MFGLDPYELLLRAPVVLFSLTIHEFMHGWTAWKCGDDTALDAGRLTLNPLAHLDPLGTIMLFVGPIGWAKPVPVVFANLKYETRRRDEILISGAGVAANLMIALVLALVARVLVSQGYAPVMPALAGGRETANLLWGFLGWAVFLNFGLAIFNLLPLFPLDGSHIMRNLLPLNAAITYTNYRQYQPLILLGLVLANWFLPINFLSWPVFHLMDLIGGTETANNLLWNMWAGKA